MSDPRIRPCASCGKDFVPDPLNKRGGRVACCSAPCMIAHRRVRAQTPESIGRRFFAKLNKAGPIPDGQPELGACWLWTASRDKFGYGRLVVTTDDRSRVEAAHRVGFFLEFGHWPEPCGLHKCDNGPLGCVRGSHVFAGTKAENTRDMVMKGRAPRPKLNPALVVDIRERLARGVPPGQVAADVGVAKSLIERVGRRQSWAHVP